MSSGDETKVLFTAAWPQSGMLTCPRDGSGRMVTITEADDGVRYRAWESNDGVPRFLASNHYLPSLVTSLGALVCSQVAPAGASGDHPKAAESLEAMRQAMRLEELEHLVSMHELTECQRLLMLIRCEVNGFGAVEVCMCRGFVLRRSGSALFSSICRSLYLGSILAALSEVLGAPSRDASLDAMAGLRDRVRDLDAMAEAEEGAVLAHP